MKKNLKAVLVFILSLSFSLQVSAKGPVPVPEETIDKNIAVKVYSYKKTRDFVAVEVGFTNMTDRYVSFTPREIYLNDQTKYSTSLLTHDEMNEVAAHRANTAKNFSTASIILGTVLGVAAVGSAVGDADEAAKWLGVAALGSLGGVIISETLSSAANNRQLVSFKNNSLRTVTKLPPGVTLGGFLYFAPVKNPTSISVVVETSKGHAQSRVIHLTRVKTSRKAPKASKYNRD